MGLIYLYPMRKILFGLVLFSTMACSDGDLQIETLDFDSVTMSQCGTAELSTTVFFKTNQEEALILELASGLFKNEVSTDSSTISSQSQLTYRIFNENVSSSYFCSDIPPAEPLVTEEIEADSGFVVITTTQQDSITYLHTIQLDDITLISAAGERITDLTISDFGSFETTVSN